MLNRFLTRSLGYVKFV